VSEPPLDDRGAGMASTVDGPVHSVVVSPDGLWIASNGDEGTIRSGFAFGSRLW